MALRVVLASIMFAVAGTGPLLAQAAIRRQLDIPAQPLASALETLAKQTQIQVVYSAELVAGRRTRALRGSMTPEEALDRLLAETRLKYEFLDAQTVTLSPAGASATTGLLDSAGASGGRVASGAGASHQAGIESESSQTPATPGQGLEHREVLQLEEIVVTGSRIKRAEIEGPAPVTIITRTQMAREGFTTVYEALNSITQATGSGSQFGFDAFSFTPNATQIDLRGLGPSRTLVLFNGRRAADYPLPFGGISNFVNLNSVPNAMVERIEVLSGGASAIYGSDAISGVLNIVTRDRFDGLAVDALIGDTTQGGGESQRLQLTGGINREAFHAVYAFEYLNQEPIWGFERKDFDSNADDPSLSAGEPVFNFPNLVLADLIAPAFGGSLLVDLPASVCSQFENSSLSSVPTVSGFYCGSPTLPAHITIRSETENVSGFFNFTYDFTKSFRLLGSLSVWQSDAAPVTFNPVWIGGPVFAAGPGFPAECIYCSSLDGQFLLVQRFYDRSESSAGNGWRYEELAWDGVIGVGGALLSDRFDWELAYHHADYTADRDIQVFVTQAINDFYLGPQLIDAGGNPQFDLLLGAFPAHAVRRDRIQRPLTPAEYRSLTAINHAEANSSNDQISLQLTGKLFDLPAGPVRFAGILEWGTQDYELNPDPRLLAGEYFGISDSRGGGERDRYAAGIELAAPVFNTLRATLAARYDKYDDITEVDDAVTYNAGLEWRPITGLLVRGSYATSFRAPDMHFIFAGRATFFGFGTDEFRCRRAGLALDECQLFSTFTSVAEGVPTLTEEEGESFTAGIVWNPTGSFDISADYFDIKLDDAVELLGVSSILQAEGDCRLGRTIGGQPIDGNSAFCRTVIGLVARNPVDPDSPLSETITAVQTRAYNRAFRSVRGVDATANYRLNTQRLGQFSFNVSWSHVLDEERQELPTDPIESFRDDARNFDLRSRVRGSIGWHKGEWTHTVFGERQGSRPHVDQSVRSGRIGRYSLFNYSVSWEANQGFKLGLIVNNVFDKSPIIDDTYSSYPFFNSAYLDPFGREIFLQAGYTFK